MDERELESLTNEIMELCGHMDAAEFRLLELIRRLDEKHPRVWLVQSHFTTIPGKGAIASTVRAELSVDYFEDCRSLMPGVIVARYRRRADAPEPLGPAARRD